MKAFKEFVDMVDAMEFKHDWSIWTQNDYAAFRNECVIISFNIEDVILFKETEKTYVIQGANFSIVIRKTGSSAVFMDISTY